MKSQLSGKKSIVLKDTLPKSLYQIVLRYPDKPAIQSRVDGVFQPITFKELWQEITQFSRGLWALGIRPGDRVGLWAENSVRWSIADWSIISLGAITVPLFPTLTSDQAVYILNDAQVKAVVVGDSKLTKKMTEAVKSLNEPAPLLILEGEYGEAISYEMVKAKGIAADLSEEDWLLGIKSAKPDDLVTFIYTSGTTGEPKGAMLDHHNFLINIEDALQAFSLTEDDKFLGFLPLSHIFGRFGDHFLAAVVGATVYQAESLSSLRADIREAGPTLMLGVPRFFQMVQHTITINAEKETGFKRILFNWALRVGIQRAKAVGNGRKLLPWTAIQFAITDKLVGKKIRQRIGGHLRFFVSGGAALPMDTAEFLMAFGILVLEGYGLTETPTFIAVNRPESIRFGTVGIPAAHVEVKIAEDGEILSRGPNTMRGYYNLPDATKEALDKDGWFHTGDIGAYENGYVRITDRKKDLLVLSNGKNIAPQHIENLLRLSEYIAEAVALGDGQAVVSALILPDFERLTKWIAENGLPSKPSELIEHPKLKELIRSEIDKVNRELADYEKVKRFEFISEQFSVEGGELTPTLKVKRRVIRQKFAPIIKRMSRGGD